MVRAPNGVGKVGGGPRPPTLAHKGEELGWGEELAWV